MEMKKYEPIVKADEWEEYLNHAVMEEAPHGDYYDVIDVQAIMAHKDLLIKNLQKEITTLVLSIPKEERRFYGYLAKKVRWMRKRDGFQKGQNIIINRSK